MSNDEMTTKPTIDTLLARLDEWGARFTNELTKVNAGQEELRADLNAGLRRVERKIEILNDNLLTIKADIRQSGHPRPGSAA
jgi:hypothetical protein